MFNIFDLKKNFCLSLFFCFLLREIAALQERLSSSEETIQKLLNQIQEKDDLILQLKHRSQLLTKICRSRPALDNLLSYMAEGEQLGSISESQSSSNSPIHEGLQETDCMANQISNNKDFSLSEDELEEQDLDKTLFGTTVWTKERKLSFITNFSTPFFRLHF